MAGDPDEVVEERRRQALEIARQRSEAMEAGYRHLLGHQDPDESTDAEEGAVEASEDG